MNMVHKIAFDNMKYYKSKNILIGIAIFLTTVLLFVIPTMGKNLIDAQHAMVNEYYPQWHALYRDVNQEMVNALSVHNDIGTFGLRSDVGFLVVENEQFKGIDVSMMYLDENGAMLYKQELSSGRYPQKENEIAMTSSALEIMGLKGELGDTISIPYQVLRSGSLDYTQEKEFVITGLIEDEIKPEDELASSTVFVSREFMESELSEEEIRYRFLFQVAEIENATTDDVEYVIEDIAKQFLIDEKTITINTSYLGANYVDPASFQITIIVMVVVVFAGIITIYSIYYVSMSQRVQEFGKLKALGASKRQMKQIVLQEGLFVALWAVPLGLIMGTIITRIIIVLLVKWSEMEGKTILLTRDIICEQRIVFYHGWIYIMVVVVAFITVYVSLLKPMKIASRVSVIEAMRYQGQAGNKGLKRRIYKNMSIAKLAKNNIASNRKKSVVTIISLSVTGVFIMVVASVLACTNPEIMTNDDFNGQYMIEPTVQNNNKEHPELAWDQLQKNNPLSEELKSKIENLDGVKRVDVFSTVDISGEMFQEGGSREDICGLPEEYAKEIEEGIIEGETTYEELKSGEKVIIDDSLLYWYPQLKVGDKFSVMVHDSDRTYEKELEIVAIGDYRGSICNHNFMIMAKEAADRLVSHNNNRYFCVMAEKDFDEMLHMELSDLCDSTGRLELVSRKTIYEMNKTGLILLTSGCYIFLGILSVICIMNLLNTMINSVHIRKKELGMMQAIGMSDHQLKKMLLMEGMFYVLGTLGITMGLGSVLGYIAFLWAKKEALLRICTFYYPWEVAVSVVVVLIVVQIFFAIMISRSVKEDSLIDRIRFND